MADDPQGPTLVVDGDSIAETLPSDPADPRRARRWMWLLGGGTLAAFEAGVLLLSLVVLVTAGFHAFLGVLIFFSAPVLISAVIILGVSLWIRLERKPPEYPMTIGVREGKLILATPGKTRELGDIGECWWHFGRTDNVVLAYPPRDCVVLVSPDGQMRLAVGWTDDARQRWAAFLAAAGARGCERPGCAPILWHGLVGSILGAVVGVGVVLLFDWIAPAARQGPWWSLPLGAAPCGLIIAISRGVVRQVPWFPTQPRTRALFKAPFVFGMMGFSAGSCAGLSLQWGLLFALAFAVAGEVLLVVATIRPRQRATASET